MTEGCIANCAVCGKCLRNTRPILESFYGELTPSEGQRGCGFAVDLGTTTVVILLLNLSDGSVLGRHSFPNPQRAYGADVISRVGASCGGERESLRRVVTESLAEGFRSLWESRGRDYGTPAAVVLAGNTAMVHLLLGFSCDCLAASPFQPILCPAESYVYGELFSAPDWACRVYIVPWLAAFVGGDITAGLYGRIAAGEDDFLLVDLGTNGELALYRNGRLFVTSTAAGPAFEGGGHTGGASAVLEDLARLRREGLIDDSGLLDSSAPPLFNQREIRDLQLAKSAVRTGIELLLDMAGMEGASPGAVYLAGGIGQAIRVESALELGLLPENFRGRLHAAGNSSLGGAALLLLRPEDRETVRRVAALAEELRLSTHPRFNDLFVDYLDFAK